MTIQPFQKGSENESSRTFAAVYAFPARIHALHSNTIRSTSVTPDRTTQLCGGLDLGQSLALLESSLLLEAEDLEAVEVGQSPSALNLFALLGPVAALPLGVDLSLLPGLGKSGLSGASGQVLDNELREESLGEVQGLSGNLELGV